MSSGVPKPNYIKGYNHEHLCPLSLHKNITKTLIMVNDVSQKKHTRSLIGIMYVSDLNNKVVNKNVLKNFYTLYNFVKHVSGVFNRS